MNRAAAKAILDRARGGADVSAWLIDAALRASGDMESTFCHPRVALPGVDYLPSQRMPPHGLAELPRTFARVALEAV